MTSLSDKVDTGIPQDHTVDLVWVDATTVAVVGLRVDGSTQVELWRREDDALTRLWRTTRTGQAQPGDGGASAHGLIEALVVNGRLVVITDWRRPDQTETYFHVECFLLTTGALVGENFHIHQASGGLNVGVVDTDGVVRQMTSQSAARSASTAVLDPDDPARAHLLVPYRVVADNTTRIVDYAVDVLQASVNITRQRAITQGGGTLLPGPTLGANAVSVLATGPSSRIMALGTVTGGFGVKSERSVQPVAAGQAVLTETAGGIAYAGAVSGNPAQTRTAFVAWSGGALSVAFDGVVTRPFPVPSNSNLEQPRRWPAPDRVWVRTQTSVGGTTWRFEELTVLPGSVVVRQFFGGFDPDYGGYALSALDARYAVLLVEPGTGAGEVPLPAAPHYLRLVTGVDVVNYPSPTITGAVADRRVRFVRRKVR